METGRLLEVYSTETHSLGFSTQQSHLKSLVADETEKTNLYVFYIKAKALIFFFKALTFVSTPHSQLSIFLACFCLKYRPNIS